MLSIRPRKPEPVPEPIPITIYKPHLEPVVPPLVSSHDLPKWLKQNEYVSLSDSATEVIFYNRTDTEQVVQISGNVQGSVTIPCGNFYICLCSSRLLEYKRSYGVRFRCLSERVRFEEMSNSKEGANRFKIVTKIPMTKVPKGLYLEVMPVKRDDYPFPHSKIITCSLNRNWSLTGRAHTYNTSCTNFIQRPLAIQTAVTRTNDPSAPPSPERCEQRDPRLRRRDSQIYK